MAYIREYLLGVIAAAIICSISIVLVGKKGSIGTSIKLLTGLVMVLVALSPWTKGKLQDFEFYVESMKDDAAAAVEDGTSYAESAVAEIIKQEASTYILDKATSLGVNVTVEVYLNETEPLVPIGVTLDGEASPYTRSVLTLYIENTLGIPAEEQRWK